MSATLIEDEQPKPQCSCKGTKSQIRKHCSSWGKPYTPETPCPECGCPASAHEYAGGKSHTRVTEGRF